MIGGVTCHILPHPSAVPHLHENTPLMLDVYGQAKSSVCSKIPLMNLLFKKLNPLAVVDFRFISAFLHAK